MIIGKDLNGLVLLIGSGNDVSTVPDNLNGTTLTRHVLTPTQETAFKALLADRAGTSFDGSNFSAIPLPAPTADEIALKARKALDETERQQARLDAAILALVNSTPAQCVTYARGNFPSLTLPEQNKIGVILNILAVAVRDKLR